MGSSPPPLRLAILETDTPQPDTKAKYGGYGGVFTYLLERAYASLSPPQQLATQLSISIHDIVNDLNAYPSLNSIDAILLTGSKHNAFETYEWIIKLVDYTRNCIDSGIRVVGVCFGHQIVGRALGCRVGRSEKGWEVAVVEVDLTPKGKEIFQLDKMRVQQMHRDEVAEFPPGSEPLAYTEICPVQGMYVPRKYITVQGHPEFTTEIMTEILNVRHKAGIFTDEMYGDAIRRAALEQDGVPIARAFLRLLRE